ncbi:U-box domain-containing protein [Xylaria castorea]|nr:U-box domain-containing protein [Xylaria castorea]
METAHPKYCSEEEDSDIKSIATLDSDKDDSVPVVTIHPIESKCGVLVKVQPPFQPLDSAIDHNPCDIVLVIDVSGSMNEEAPAPAAATGEGNEHFGLSVLDLTKHAARTIVSTLNEGDRLGIVTFSHGATIVQKLVPMTKAHKEEVNAKIDRIEASGQTNLWSGINSGLKLFQRSDRGVGVPALMVLTDGQPNHMCPEQGYVKKLRSLHPLSATINTFGFGYEIRSGLLKSIAEVGNGNYAFIPDAGMIGTVFVHAVAHLQSTFATRCTLEISAAEGMLLRSTIGKSIDEPRDEAAGKRMLMVQLGNLQYGQSRDIYLENVDESRRPAAYRLGKGRRIMTAQLIHSRMQAPRIIVFADWDMIETSSLSRSVIAYHQSRSMICKLLSSFFALYPSLEYEKPLPKNMEDYQEHLKKVLDTIPARHYEDRHNVSLMEDLNGQIREALSTQYYFTRWGCHYFLSLWNAHAKQLCNSFKDPGPLMYNDNPFFIKCRDVLDKTFDDIPSPTPSIRSNRSSVLYRNVPIPMARYNDAARICFAASSPVLLATGLKVPVSTLQRGMMVQTPLGPRRVRAVLKNLIRESAMCRVGNLVVTPWHPINTDQSEHGTYSQGGWAFPMDVAKETTTYSGTICSVLLEPDGNVDAHAIHVGGVWGVTLGHGVLDGSDARAHPFFGDHSAILEAISKEFPDSGPGDDGVYWGLGMTRDANTGLVCGFDRLLSAYNSDDGKWHRVRL